MRFARFLAIAGLAISLPVSAFAANKTLICSKPMGPRLDYFTSNTANLKNNDFLVGRDSMSDVQIRLVFDENGQDVSFTLGTKEQLKNIPKMKNMKVVETTKDQISFFGKLNNAPLLATFYPAMSIVFYTQQSTWPGDTYAGARAMLFYARCHDEAHMLKIAAPQPAPPAQASSPSTPQSAVEAEPVQGLNVPDVTQPQPVQQQPASQQVAPTQQVAPARQVPPKPALVAPSTQTNQ